MGELVVVLSKADISHVKDRREAGEDVGLELEGEGNRNESRRGTVQIASSPDFAVRGG